MMLTHTWIEHYQASQPNVAASMYEALRGAVQFDCGQLNAIPVGKGSEFILSRPPFTKVILQFETPSNEDSSHALVLWQEMDDGTAVITCAQRHRVGKKWLTCAPAIVTRDELGLYWERIGYDRNGPALEAILIAATNLFYVLGCSNVATSDIPAPASLNKKRARAGKLPLFEYKTLVVKLDEKHNPGIALGGTHSSPRLHLRRGHVRRLDSGRRVWVQSCVVGSKHGIIVKDYRITTKQSSQENENAY